MITPGIIKHNLIALFPETFIDLHFSKMASDVVICYVICWTPYWLLILYTSLFRPFSYPTNSQQRVFLALFHLLPYINLVLNPFIYIAYSKDFFHEIWAIFHWQKRRRCQYTEVIQNDVWSLLTVKDAWNHGHVSLKNNKAEFFKSMYLRVHYSPFCNKQNGEGTKTHFCLMHHSWHVAHQFFACNLHISVPVAARSIGSRL